MKMKENTFIPPLPHKSPNAQLLLTCKGVLTFLTIWLFEKSSVLTGCKLG
jgi:hypothetical protein